MTKQGENHGNRSKSLPLEGGGKRVGANGNELTTLSRGLRKRSTDTETYLWRHLRDRRLDDFKFRRQQPMGSYIVDFVNFERKVVIELDGGQHATNISYDNMRDEWLKNEGYKALRFWDNEVFNNLEGVLETIRRALLTPHPDPLPQGERE
jgi:very-short-patch-repair endonuclease